MDKFKTITQKITGKVIVKENTQFNNIDAESVIVERDIIARLYGNIQELLILKKGAVVFLHGILYGDVKNDGGEVHIFNKEN